MADSLAEAKQAALDALATAKPRPADVIEFRAQGRVAVLAPPGEPAAASAMDDLSAAGFAPSLIPDAAEVRGHLGAFKISRGDEKTAESDTVLDFFSPPLARQQNPDLDVLPLGYFEARERENFQDAGMRGTFHKPRYYEYDPGLCAHGAGGCRRCIDACPALAISSAGDKVSVDSNLCQGCGLCAMTCPSGAMRYAYPRPADSLGALQSAIAAWRGKAADAPTVAFFSAENPRAQDIPDSPRLLPAAVEEAAAAGLETWLCMLAFGASGVAVFADNPRLARLAREQADVACAITGALGFRDAVHVYEDPAEMRAQEEPPLVPSASFLPDDDKRTMFFAALDHLLQAASESPEPAALPAGAPFGEIVVNEDACTLCMACAGACPASAVRAAGDLPRLNFVEENCLQCGLCEKACPEDAISLRPRLVFDPASRRRTRVLNEDQPVTCLACNKPFAGARMIRRIEEKLQGHWMFQDDAQKRRLRLCEECRVRDMFSK